MTPTVTDRGGIICVNPPRGGFFIAGPMSEAEPPKHVAPCAFGGPSVDLYVLHPPRSELAVLLGGVTVSNGVDLCGVSDDHVPERMTHRMGLRPLVDPLNFERWSDRQCVTTACIVYVRDRQGPATG